MEEKNPSTSSTGLEIEMNKKPTGLTFEEAMEIYEQECFDGIFELEAICRSCSTFETPDEHGKTEEGVWIFRDEDETDIALVSSGGFDFQISHRPYCSLEDYQNDFHQLSNQSERNAERKASIEQLLTKRSRVIKRYYDRCEYENVEAFCVDERNTIYVPEEHGWYVCGSSWDYSTEYYETFGFVHKRDHVAVELLCEHYAIDSDADAIDFCVPEWKEDGF